MVRCFAKQFGTVARKTGRHVFAGWCNHCCIAGLLVAFSSCAIYAQSRSENYRKTILSIQQLIEGNQLEEAHTLLSSASRQYPNDGGLENLLGIVQVEQGNVPEARAAFSAAIRHDPHLESAYMNLSRIDMRTAENDSSARAEALDLSEKALRLEPANDEAKYQIATLYAWEKKYQPSLQYLARLSPKARMMVGAEALACTDSAALGDKAATSKAAAALAANPNLTEQDAASCLLALRSARRADLIEKIYVAANSVHPLSSAGLRTLGLAEEAEGKLAEARVNFELAYATEPASVLLLQDLARVAREAKDYKGALGYLAHARDLEPGNASLPYEFGAICLQMGLYGESRKAIEEAVRLDPQNPAYNLGLGTLISYSEDPTQALPYLMKYHSLRPQDPAGALTLGATYFRAKEYDKAQEWLNQAITSPKSAPEGYFYLGRIARQEGHADQAMDDLKKSLVARPDQPDALAELGQIYVTSRNYAQAAALLDRAVKLEPDNYAGNFGLLELYARTRDPRLSAQSARFTEIKNKKEQWDRDMMRVLEIRK